MTERAHTYAVKDMFLTLQGEGARSGTKAAFLRFSGCNLWSGLPAGRATGRGACARWCDTDFVGGDRMTALEVVMRLNSLWGGPGPKWVVATGGEPMLQLDEALLDALTGSGWRTAVESNGTIPIAHGVRQRIDWLCVSPKVGALGLQQFEADELKVVLPGAVAPEVGWSDEDLEVLAVRGRWRDLIVNPQDPVNPQTIGATHLLGAAEDSGAWETAVARCVEFVMSHPQWRLGVQVHKIARLP